jgi:hypothetical protein
MKNIIALYGRANSGKSKTIKQVCKLLKKHNPTPQYNVLKNGVDIKIIMIIDGIKIGIESQGDPNSRLEKSLKTFCKEGCLIIVCATRTRGMTVDWVNALSDYSVKWFQQSYTEAIKQEKSNHSQAQKIIDRVMEII